MMEILTIIVFMGVVCGVAALILVFRDKLTLRRHMSAEERQTAITKRTARLQRKWATAMFVMALIALPVNVFGLGGRPLRERVIYFIMAALYVWYFLSSYRRHQD
jgi:phosphatidylglycerophosphate synthase